MINLNVVNGADALLLKYAQFLTEKIKDIPLIGAELGIAYGGGVEAIGKMWKDCGGTIYGLDTFSGHPKQLSSSPDNFEATCMDGWYQNYGIEALEYDYQRKTLDEQNLSNVILIKGLINSQSLANVPYLHYALLDMDLIASMTVGWEIVRPLMKKGGYLCLHDVVPRGHITGLWELYQEILAQGYKVVEEAPSSYLAVLEKT
ncbi:MAG: hypothetical protein M0R80_02845 [Proteobacteria bacterium]|jgi:hypothetical protein|nr:hypothetical protein [Pseudomonadota bacterium]